MSFVKNWKGTGPDHIGGEQSDEYDHHQKSNEKRNLFGHAFSTEEQYEPPPGPPPNGANANEMYAPPPGPPPYHQSEDFAPPPGPPPGHVAQEYAAPPGPPPNQGESANPPPYHDWTVIPDTALLPPPPTVRHENSTNNSSEEDAIRAHKWVERNPLYTPSKPNPGLQKAVQNGEVNLVRPQEYRGDLSLGKYKTWKGHTSSTGDSILLTAVPLYFAAVDSPLQTGLEKTIYYEVKMLKIGGSRRHRDDSGLAMGFCAQPYPSWRLPGHERASLGVHGDDGRRFVNDSYGGIDFTKPFREGDTLGIGMKFTSQRGANDGAGVEIFFTRNGERQEGWNLDEERDESSGDTEGLEGRWDLYGAIGVFGDVEFEASFARDSWLYRPR